MHSRSYYLMMGTRQVRERFSKLTFELHSALSSESTWGARKVLSREKSMSKCADLWNSGGSYSDFKRT